MKNKLLRKSHVIDVVISLLLIVSMFSTIVLAERDEIKSNGINTIIFDDELDQSQTQHDNLGLAVGHDYQDGLNWSAAQSFIPQKSILTRVELFICCIGYSMSNPYVLAIREELNGVNLAVASVSHTQIPPWSPLEWIEFDFEDIPVIAGETYYLVSYTTATYDNIYIWGGGENNPYSKGNGFVSIDGGQTYEPLFDMDTCFKTYGKASDLDIGKITGGLGKVCVEINNNYDSAIEDISWSISVQGGILNRINVVTEGTIDVLEVGASEIVCTDRFIFGLGTINIVVTVESAELGEISKTAEGLVLLFIIIIR